MSSRFIMPFADVGSGIKPSSGAKLFFFETDGVTPKNTFSDQLSVPTANTNPVIANSNGVFGDIYISGDYKVTLKDKNLSQIFGLAAVSEIATGNFDINLINDLSQAYEFPTVAAFKASLIEFPDGKTIRLLDRGADFTKISGTGTGNDKNIIASTSVSQSASLIADKKVNPKWLGAVEANDNADIYQFAVDNYVITDCEDVETKLHTVVLLPAGAKLLNVNVNNTVRIDSIIQVSSGCEVTAKIDGSDLVTDNTLAIERGIYGLDANDVKLDVTVSKVSMGVHSQTSVTTVGGAKAKRWSGIVRATDISGDGVAGGSYGVIIVNTDDCNLVVYGTDVPRHGMYISAGSSNNTIDFHADGVLKSSACNIFALPTQNPGINNTVNIHAKNIDSFGGEGRCLTVIQNVHNNVVTVHCEDSDGLDGFIKVEGLGGAGQNDLNTPLDNVISFKCEGDTVASSVLLLNQRGTTILDGSSINGGSTDVAQAAIRIQDDLANPAYTGLAARIGRVTLKGGGKTTAIKAGAKGFVQADLSYIDGYTNQLVDDTGTFEGVIERQRGFLFSGILTPGTQSMTSIVFDRAFPSAPLVSLSIANNTVDGNEGDVWATDVTTTGFDLYTKNTAATDSSYKLNWSAEF